MLKAIVTAKTKEFPPRIHNLVRLADLAEVILSQESRLSLEKMSYYYLEARYPQEIIKIGKGINKRLAIKYFEKTKEIIRWLKQKVK